MARLKIFDGNLIHCTIDTISLVDMKSVKEPILVVTRTIIRPKSKFFAISKIENKESENACNILSGLFIVSCHKRPTGAKHSLNKARRSQNTVCFKPGSLANIMTFCMSTETTILLLCTTLTFSF